MNLKHLSDDTLLLHVDRCIKQERKITVILLSYFAEIENRQLYLQSSKTSMFQWLVEMNNYSNGAAARRLAAARLIHRFPWIAKKIELGELHLTALHSLSSHKDAPDFEALLVEGCGKSRLGLEELLARRSNKVAPRREVVRMFVGKVSKINSLAGNDGFVSSPTNQPKVGSPEEQLKINSHDEQSKGSTVANRAEVGLPVDQARVSSPANQALFGSPENKPRLGSPANQDQGEEVEKTLMRMTLTIDTETFEALKHAQKLTDSKDMATVVKLALQVFIEKKDPVKKLQASVKVRKIVKEKTKPVSKSSRYIPIAIRRQVHERDGGQCTYTHNGQRCQERVHIQLDHIIPYALQGNAELDNLRDMCRAHNLWRAKQSFGREFIENKIKERQVKRASSPMKLNRIERNISPPVNQS